MAEKRDVVVVRGRYTVRIFYFKMEIMGVYLKKLGEKGEGTEQGP